MIIQSFVLSSPFLCDMHSLILFFFVYGFQSKFVKGRIMFFGCFGHNFQSVLVLFCLSVMQCFCLSVLVFPRGME